MSYYKLGDEVYVLGKITEIRQNEEGVGYEIHFPRGAFLMNKISLPESELIEKKENADVS